MIKSTVWNSDEKDTGSRIKSQSGTIKAEEGASNHTQS